ncbi:hypothetical protein [Nocardioides limicola]|uniref:hypothetical protein n=1 Tax=Nocardioides limicola TaxID=2803368 RepID=UPI00193BF0B1|nr:hypothetical protein [Nocardioides sp. DJM-14]
MSTNEPPNEPPNQPPPPPPGYGAPPPPPAGAPGPSVDIGAAFKYAFEKFQANLGPFVIAGLAIFGVLVFGGIVQAVISSMSNPTLVFDMETGRWVTSGGLGFIATNLVNGVIGLVVNLVAMLIMAGMIRSALDITAGRPVTAASMFRTDQLVQVFVAAVLIAIGGTIGLLLCVLPGIVFYFFTSYTLHFVGDRNLTAVEAIKASFNFVKDNFVQVLLVYLCVLAVTIVGAILCLVGLIAAIPIGTLLTAYAFRSLHNEPIAA